MGWNRWGFRGVSRRQLAEIRRSGWIAAGRGEQSRCRWRRSSVDWLFRRSILLVGHADRKRARGPGFASGRDLWLGCRRQRQPVGSRQWPHSEGIACLVGGTVEYTGGSA